MSFKLLGVLAVVLGCGGFGFRMAACHRLEEKYIRQLLTVLDQMQCELEYRLTPLPELCGIACENCTGKLRALFTALSAELDRQIAPDAQCCMRSAVSDSELSRTLKELLLELGRGLGSFDLNGQLRGIEAVRRLAIEALQESVNDRDVRIRSYQTLGLCAGAALAILLL